MERAKFDLFPAAPQKETFYAQDLPAAYGETRITFMVRDPFWAYAYWEIEPQKLEELKRSIGKDAQQAQMVLRVYDVTDIKFNGANAHHYFDIEITALANNWYIHLDAPHKSFCVDIGLKTATTFSRVISDLDYHVAEDNVMFMPGAVGFSGVEYGKVIEVDYTTRAVVFEASITPPTSAWGMTFHRAERLPLYPPD